MRCTVATRKAIKHAPSKKAKSKVAPALNVVSLFAGAGGLDFAFCETGYVGKLFSTDSHPTFLQTVKNNVATHFPKLRHSHLVADARTLSGAEIQECVGAPVDLVIGGPPCDDFTSFGLKRGMGGEKGPIIFEFARLVQELKPKAFLFENVPNLRAMCKGGFDELVTRLCESGYRVDFKILAACDYGAPTVRQRLFVVGFAEDSIGKAFHFPESTHGKNSSEDLFSGEGKLHPYATVGQVLAGLPNVKTPDGEKFLNHTGRHHRPETIQHMMSVAPGTAVSKSFRYRPSLEGQSRSLTAGLDSSTKSYLHPVYHREMSVREYARIHGFPDSWEFSGTHHNGIKQVANAVPIQLGMALAIELTKALSAT